MTQNELLALKDIDAAYGKSQILFGISLHVNEGEVVSLIGRNGAGKTTTLRNIVGILTPTQGQITFDGGDITKLPDYETVKHSISYVREGKKVFPDLTVQENLQMGALTSEEGVFTLEEVFNRFPRLRERQNQIASSLSGGEQQMLVIARALLSPTKILLLDEPTEGLAPQIVSDVIDIIEDISQEGVTVLLVEQNMAAAMAVADRHYVISKGEIVYEGTTSELETATNVQEKYLGVGTKTANFND